MPQPALPVSSVIAWADLRGLDEVVIIGRDAAGKVHMGSTHGELRPIYRLINEALLDLGRSMERRSTTSDLEALGAVRHSNDLIGQVGRRKNLSA